MFLPPNYWYRHYFIKRKINVEIYELIFNVRSNQDLNFPFFLGRCTKIQHRVLTVIVVLVFDYCQRSMVPKIFAVSRYLHCKKITI